jgi:hypothetical protein
VRRVDNSSGNLMPHSTLRETLLNWTDADIAAYHLALCLGLMSVDVDFAVKAKHVFWTDNNIGNLLYQILEELAQQAVLEKRDEPDYQFRWNSEFVGSWQ